MSEGPSKLVRNEQLKLRAAALNGVAIAAVVAGFVTPLATLSYGIGATTSRGLIGAILAILAWLALGWSLHYIAWRMLGRLQE